MAAFGLEGKEAACRELCRAQFKGGASNAASSALSKINEPLCTCVKDLLRDESRDVQVAALQRLGTLPAENVPMAALELLAHYKEQLRTRRKSPGKPDYLDDACPGQVIDVMWSATLEQKRTRDELRPTLVACLKLDMNTFALAAAVRYIADTTKTPDEAADLLLQCFNRFRTHGTPEKGKEERLQRVDGLRLAIVQALSRPELLKNPRVRVFLKDVSNNDSAKDVRDEATRVLK
jgi:hypothetical protein